MGERLAAWAPGTVGDVRRMPGHSGLSYGFSLDGEDLVIRVPPLGVKRSGTTDVLRQVPLERLLARYEHSSGRRLERPAWFRALAGLRLGTLTAYFLHRTGRRWSHSGGHTSPACGWAPDPASGSPEVPHQVRHPVGSRSR